MFSKEIIILGVFLRLYTCKKFWDVLTMDICKLYFLHIRDSYFVWKLSSIVLCTLAI
jgi:hypothetical protein